MEGLSPSAAAPGKRGPSGGEDLHPAGIWRRMLRIHGLYQLGNQPQGSGSEFIGAMERMHITEKIVIPMSVIFRFFPTISEEYQAIRDAMKMRGIRSGGRHPLLMVEYRLVPLMVSVVKIGDELSAAALTRGLGAPVKRTNVCQIGFHVQDLIAILFCVICFALFLFQQQISF